MHTTVSCFSPCLGLQVIQSGKPGTLKGNNTTVKLELCTTVLKLAHAIMLIKFKNTKDLSVPSTTVQLPTHVTEKKNVPSPTHRLTQNKLLLNWW